jgi:hypothetical protein
VTALAIVLAVAMGVTQGLLGAGGSILSIPILSYVAGFEAKQTIGVSLAVVATTSLIGAWGYWRAGYVRPRIALPFALLSMSAAFAGARLARHMDGRLQLLVFSLLTLSAALAMLVRRAHLPPRPASAFGSSRSGLVLFGALALAIGVLTGVAGIGGGFLIVPGLIAVAGLSIREAAGTSFVATMLNSAAGLLGYHDQFVMPWLFLALFTFAAAAGTLGGTRLARFVDPIWLRRAFAVLLLAVGAAMVAEHWVIVAEWRGGA